MVRGHVARGGGEDLLKAHELGLEVSPLGAEVVSVLALPYGGLERGVGVLLNVVTLLDVRLQGVVEGLKGVEVG